MVEPAGSESIDRRRTFDQVAPAYHAARPGYPPALFDRLAELLPPEPSILEVGPGTGQATEPLLQRGATVRAVELGPNMAEVIRRRLAATIERGHLTVEVGDFEQLPSPAGVRPPIHRRMCDAPDCTDVTLDRFRWDQTYTAESYERLLGTFSGTLAMEPLARSQMVRELVDLVRARGGSITRPLVITLATCSYESSEATTRGGNTRE